MCAADDSSEGCVHDPLDHLRHDLKTPLTIIHGRVQLLARGVRRSPSLNEEERATMLAGLAAIEVAVREMVTLIDSMGDKSRRP